MTNLVASMIVAEVEKDRYLVPCVAELLTVCDEVVMLFDGDGAWAEELVHAEPWGEDGSRVIGVHEESVDFFAHEGRARQRLLRATLQRGPTHILAIDADEFLSSPQAIREAVDDDPNSSVWTCCMQEVWNATEDALELRQDGGWVEHDVSMLWRVAAFPRPTILDRPLACGRIPQEARYRHAQCVYSACLHFGWTNRATREQRHERYAVADGGRYHAGSHLDSILWEDDACWLTMSEWPDALVGRRDTILAATRGTTEGAQHGR